MVYHFQNVRNLNVCFNLLIFLISIFNPLLSQSQQVEIENDFYSSYGTPNFYYTPTFNDKYSKKHSYFTLTNTALYRINKVKKVEAFDFNGRLTWMTELDQYGRIIKEGRIGNHYFIVEYSFIPKETKNFFIPIETKNFTVSEYFRNSLLIRLDTAITGKKTFNFNDTTFSFTRTTIKIYKTGKLINEQNNYYNKNYHNKPVTDVIYHNWVYGNDSQPEVYFKTKLKNDYDSGQIYLCQIQTCDKEFSVMNKNNFYFLYNEGLKYRLKANYNDHPLKQCFADGECFDEPKKQLFSQGFRCGTAVLKEQEYRRKLNFGFSLNEKGLYESYYSIYENKNYNKTILYTFKYTYFE